MGGSPGRSNKEKRATRAQTDALGQQMGLAGQLGSMAGSGDVMSLAGSGLTQAEQMQMDTVGLGLEQAQQGIQQNVRDEATARGMFSSGGAIAQEAGQLAGLDTFMAQQRADIYGQAQQRQFQGLGMRSGLLGQAMGGMGQSAQGFGGQSQQFAQQRQQKQQQQMGGIRSAVGLAAAPFTGGASLAMIG